MDHDVAWTDRNISWLRRAFYDGEYWPFSRRAARAHREHQNIADLIDWAQRRQMTRAKRG